MKKREKGRVSGYTYHLDPQAEDEIPVSLKDIYLATLSHVLKGFPKQMTKVWPEVYGGCFGLAQTAEHGQFIKDHSSHRFRGLLPKGQELSSEPWKEQGLRLCLSVTLCDLELENMPEALS